jgi:hypothetical protein
MLIMAEAHVVAALKDKRAELSGSIADLEKRIDQHRADLLHVDAVLRLFAPEFEPATIPPRAVRRPNSWFKPGELARLLLEVLRMALAPLSVREITMEIMERRGLDPPGRPNGGVAAQAGQQCPELAGRRSGRADPGRCPGQLAGARVIRRRGGCVANSRRNRQRVRRG